MNSAEKFREFLNNINLDLLRGEFSSGRRKQLAGEVIQVSQKTVPLDPLTECTEVQNMINLHNATNPFPRLQIKRTIFFTGYLLNKSDADNLITLLDDSILKAPDVKILAHNIMITTKPATEAVLDKVGGLGAKQIWQVTAIGNWNGSIYGAKVNPIPSSAVVSVESSTPVVVLATLRGAKSVDSQRITNWQALPTDKHFVFETTVGENVQLRIEPEQEGESEYDSLLPKMHAPHTFAQKRKVAQNENERSGRGDDRRVNGGFRGGRGARDRDRGERRLRDRDSGMRSGGRATTIREHRNDRIQRKQQQRNNNYRSLDDISNGSAVATQYRNEAYSAGNSVYVDHSSDLRQPHDAGDRYTSAGGPAKHSGGYDGNDDGGLHY